MTLEEAIKTALDYEIRVRNIYADAVERVADPAGKRILEMLRDDENVGKSLMVVSLEGFEPVFIFDFFNLTEKQCKLAITHMHKLICLNNKI